MYLLSTLDDVKTAADIAQAIVTTLAIVVGAVWAYYKFLRGRIFRPHLDITLRGQWRTVDGAPLFHARITVKNIGSSAVRLIQKGSGLKVETMPAVSPRTDAKGLVVWESPRAPVKSVLVHHEWIEPGETVSDDLLMNLNTSPVTTRLQARLVMRSGGGRKRTGSSDKKAAAQHSQREPADRRSFLDRFHDNVAVTAVRILPPNNRLDDTESPVPAKEAGVDGVAQPRPGLPAPPLSLEAAAAALWQWTREVGNNSNEED